LCHLGLVRALLALDARLDEEALFPLLQRKDLPGLSVALGQLPGLAPGVHSALLALPTLYGSDPADVLTRARAQLPNVAAVQQALDELERLVQSPLLSRSVGASLTIDLGDLRGYRYHTGITFAAYVTGRSGSIARGGRYDNIGAVFGRGRPATGFSLELRELAALAARAEAVSPSPAIRSPWLDDPALAAAIVELRTAGEIVVQMVGSTTEQEEYRFDRELVFRDGAWKVQRLIDTPSFE
jgi:ATP phosphoribosyltransferase regulatory subunit